MPDRLPDVNLLPKYERQSAGAFYLFLAIIILTLLAYGFIGVYYFTTKSKLTNAEATYTELSEKADGLRAQVDELETGGTGLAQAVTFAENYNIPTSILIEELNEYLPERGYLSEYSYSNQVAEVTTHFEALDVVAGYTTDLLTSDYIRDTKVDNIETFLLKEEENATTVDFSTIPRYESKFTLQINKQNLKGASREDE